MTTATESPRIYRACLACYNSGNLVGEWFDATDADTVESWQAAHELLTSHEEYVVHDYDEMPNLGEYPTMERIVEVAEMVERHGYGPVNAYLGNFGTDADLDSFEDVFCGEWRSEVAFAENLLDDMGELKDDSLASRYFDYEAFTRDLFMGDYWSADLPSGLVAVFRNS